MIVDCPISLGELVDKVTILEIKSVKVSDIKKIENIQKELSLLSQKLSELGVLSDYETQKDKDSLFEINSKLWEIEDLIRDREHNQIFDEEFIKLARSVYITNDERFRVKNSINLRYNSLIREEKSYKGY